jgi:hypothetical protein
MFGLLAAAGASVVSGVLGMEAADEAADATTAAARTAADVHRETFQTTRKDLAPYRGVGKPALQELMLLSGLGDRGRKSKRYGSLTDDFSFGLKDFAKDPGYEFRLGEGEKALTRAMSARGLGNSTPGLRALMRFNQDYASGEFDQAFGRAFTIDSANKAQKFNVLSYLAGTGQNAAAMTGQAGANMAAGVSGAAMAGGAGQANSIMAGHGALNNAVQGGIGNYMYQQRFDEMMKRMPVFGGSAPATMSAPSYGAPNQFD